MSKRAAHVVIFMVIIMMAVLPGLLSATNSAPDTVVIQAKKIYTAASPVITDGRILIENRRIDHEHVKYDEVTSYGS